jgi:hypothetical protein
MSGSFNDLLQCFPVLEPPLTLSGEVITNFSSQNPPIPEKAIAEYFSKWEEFDEFTEIIPCFRLDNSFDFHALVYWKGGLMTYEYKLLTLSKNGEPITKKVIAGTLSNNQTIKESVAHIQTDYSIYTVVGEARVDLPGYHALNSTSFHFGLLEDGSIESIIEEEPSIWEESEERKN